MKKIIFILSPFLLFFTTGCWDYIELNDLAIVAGIGIDYDNDLYKVTYEILDDAKIESESYLIKGVGKTYIEAVKDASLKSSKNLYFMHTKIMIIGKSLALKNLSQTIDYELRLPTFSNVFYTVIANNAEEIFEISNEKIPIIASNIEKLLKNSLEENTIAAPYTFEKILSLALNYGSEMVISSIEKEESYIKLNGLAAFKEFNLQGYLDNEESLTFNLLKNENFNVLYSKNCENDKQITLSVYEGGSKISADNKKIKIDINVLGAIVEDNCSYNLLEENTYLTLENDFQKIIKNNINNLIIKTKTINADILGLREAFYKKNRIKLDEFWKELDVDISINVDINRKGLIYGVQDDN